MPQVKMVEIKLSQGAKPGTGGLLPKEKITPEIAAIRGIPLGVDCQSPNGFDEFHDAPSLLALAVDRSRAISRSSIPRACLGSVSMRLATCASVL